MPYFAIELGATDQEATNFGKAAEVASFGKPAPAREVERVRIDHIESAQRADRKSWSLERGKGFIDGLTSRKGKTEPSRYALVGRDEYCLGFREGYFASDRKSSRSKNDNGR